MSLPAHIKRVKNIVEGAAAAITGENQDLHDFRLSICRGDATGIRCPRFLDKVGGICALCGCSLNMKLRVKSQHCPADPPKW